MKPAALFLFAFTAAALPALAQDKGKEPPPPVAGVDETQVQLAIQKGIEFLRKAKSPDFHNAYRNSDVLILWTFIHAGVPESDPDFQRLFQSVMGEPLERTYKVALTAMCKDGANAYLKAQAADGSWGKDTDWFNTTWDTCFAILFLRRAARPLVATESAGKLKK
jgi:hypothetical protein